MRWAVINNLPLSDDRGLLEDKSVIMKLYCIYKDTFIYRNDREERRVIYCRLLHDRWKETTVGTRSNIHKLIKACVHCTPKSVFKSTATLVYNLQL